MAFLETIWVISIIILSVHLAFEDLKTRSVSKISCILWISTNIIYLFVWSSLVFIESIFSFFLALSVLFFIFLYEKNKNRTILQSIDKLIFLFCCLYIPYDYLHFFLWMIAASMMVCQKITSQEKIPFLPCLFSSFIFFKIIFGYPMTVLKNLC